MTEKILELNFIKSWVREHWRSHTWLTLGATIFAAASFSFIVKKDYSLKIQFDLSAVAGLELIKAQLASADLVKPLTRTIEQPGVSVKKLAVSSEAPHMVGIVALKSAAALGDDFERGVEDRLNAFFKKLQQPGADSEFNDLASKDAVLLISQQLAAAHLHLLKDIKDESMRSRLLVSLQESEYGDKHLQRVLNISGYILAQGNVDRSAILSSVESLNELDGQIQDALSAVTYKNPLLSLSKTLQRANPTWGISAKMSSEGGVDARYLRSIFLLWLITIIVLNGMFISAKLILIDQKNQA